MKSVGPKLPTPDAFVIVSKPEVVREFVTDTVKDAATTDAKPLMALAIVALDAVVFSAAVVLLPNCKVNVPPVGYQDIVARMAALKMLAVALEAVEST